MPIVRHPKEPQRCRAITSANVSRMARKDFQDWLDSTFRQELDEETRDRLWNGFAAMFSVISGD